MTLLILLGIWVVIVLLFFLIVELSDREWK